MRPHNGLRQKQRFKSVGAKTRIRLTVFCQPLLRISLRLERVAMVSVWLYVPNLIGYVRILSGLAAFWVCRNPSSWATFFCLYAFSYGLDAVDGVAARALGQTSRLGAVLDMVTDRFCTAALLALLSCVYTSGPLPPVLFIFLMVLDVVSHWTQMYRCGRMGDDNGG
jgi:CDP-diacylglycerol--inositol 3-phosphatidyltransferase